MSVITKNVCYQAYAKIRSLFWVGDMRCGSPERSAVKGETGEEDSRDIKGWGFGARSPKFLYPPKNLICLFIFDLSFMPESTFQPSLMSNSWCLNDPYGIIRQFCPENALVGDNIIQLM